MGYGRWDAGDDFILGCADFKMPLRNTDSEILLMRQLDVGASCS